MKISLDWLHDYCDFDLSAQALADCLSQRGMGIESVTQAELKRHLNKLPPAQRGLVEEIFNKHLEPMKGLVRQENQKALGVMAKQGIKTVTPAAKDTKELRASVFKAMDTLGEEQFSKKTFEEMKSLLKALRKEN